MIKQIKKYGNSFVVVLNQEDLKYLDAAEGDLINMVDSYKIEKNNFMGDKD